jgi:hypothetical protein
MTDRTLFNFYSDSMRWSTAEVHIDWVCSVPVSIEGYSVSMIAVVQASPFAEGN